MPNANPIPIIVRSMDIQHSIGAIVISVFEHVQIYVNKTRFPSDVQPGYFTSIDCGTKDGFTTNGLSTDDLTVMNKMG
jgi:hypothetical protein